MDVVIPSARFGRYRITARLAELGIAEVFRAEVVAPSGDLQTVALKLVKRGLTGDAGRFLAAEAHGLEGLAHPNLIAKLEAGEVAGRPWLAVEDVFGCTLSELVAAFRGDCEPVPPDVALAVVVELLTALEYLHARGRVHGQVTPASVLLSVRGEVKLGDVALPLREPGRLHHLSPEQARGEPARSASDLFAAGVILFELALGFRPFDGASEKELLEQIATCALEGPDGIVHPRLARILRTALAPDPEDRFPGAAAMREALAAHARAAGLSLDLRGVALQVVERLGIVA